MTDNEIFKEIITVINAGLTAQAISGVAIKQAYQPISQGANTAPTVYLAKLFDRRYGHMQREDVWDQDEEIMIHTERQYYMTDFQVTTLAIQNPMTPDAMTASDLVNTICSILQGDITIKSLKEKGIGILRVTEVRNPYFVDDRDRFEASPSFDFTLAHERAVITTSPVIVTQEFNISRV